jgi:hypothetical protein
LRDTEGCHSESGEVGDAPWRESNELVAKDTPTGNIEQRNFNELQIEEVPINQANLINIYPKLCGRTSCLSPGSEKVNNEMGSKQLHSVNAPLSFSSSFPTKQLLPGP